MPTYRFQFTSPMNISFLNVQACSLSILIFSADVYVIQHQETFRSWKSLRKFIQLYPHRALPWAVTEDPAKGSNFIVYTSENTMYSVHLYCFQSENWHILDIAAPGKVGLISNHEAFLPPYPIIKFSLSPLRPPLFLSLDFKFLRQGSSLSLELCSSLLFPHQNWEHCQNIKKKKKVRRKNAVANIPFSNRIITIAQLSFSCWQLQMEQGDVSVHFYWSHYTNH